MRIGMDYRILSVGPAWVNRGMVRHTQYQLREVLSRDADNDYLLFCHGDADLSLVLPEIREAPNVSMLRVPRWLTAAKMDDANVLSVAEAYQEWLAERSLDVYHATTPFYDEVQPFLTELDACPVVATLYDLIPLIYPDEYLTGRMKRRNYLLALIGLRRATRIIAISESARRDCLQLLGVDPARVDVAWPISSPCFRPLSRRVARLRLAALESHRRIPDAFALVVTARHHAKNLEGCLRAYASLPRDLRSRLPLVLGGHLGERDPGFADHLSTLGIQSNTIFTGLLTEDQLAALYNLATFLVHPSNYEGFGLPVLEAMRCGTPVITSTASSLPEVAGDAGLLIHPHDVAGLADAMAALEGDPDRRAAMRERGLRRAQQFHGSQLAETTIRCYDRAATPPAIRRRERRRLGLWTPLPPHQSGVADFSIELMDTLSPHLDLEVFVDSMFLPSPAIMTRHRIRHFGSFRRRQAADPFDLLIYEFGASYFHRYMYETIQEHPGVIDLHDLSWSRVLYHDAIISGNPALFERQLQTLEGEAALREFRAMRKAGTLDFFDDELSSFLDTHLMLRRVLAASLAQIVHFPAAKHVLQDRYPETHTYVIPMGVEDPYHSPNPPTTAAAKLACGMDPTAFVVGVFGIIDPVKRLEAIIHAFADLLVVRPASQLVLVGLFLQEEYQQRLLELASELGVSDRVRLTGHIPRPAFDAHLIGCDVVVNLRYPSQRQMSAIIMRAAAAGKPVIASAIHDWSFIPENFCLRVPSDDREISVLTEHLCRLAGDGPLLARASEAARRFYLAEGTLELMGRRYREVIDDVLDSRVSVRHPERPERMAPSPAPCAIAR